MASNWSRKKARALKNHPEWRKQSWGTETKIPQPQPMPSGRRKHQKAETLRERLYNMVSRNRKTQMGWEKKKKKHPVKSAHGVNVKSNTLLQKWKDNRAEKEKVAKKVTKVDSKNVARSAKREH